MANPGFATTLAICLAVVIATFITYSEGAPRAFFVFGDSLVDNGNNNYLATTARADSPPYGVDYPTHSPTGRFSNGLNLPDLISEFQSSYFFFLICISFDIIIFKMKKLDRY